LSAPTIVAQASEFGYRVVCSIDREARGNRLGWLLLNENARRILAIVSITSIPYLAPSPPQPMPKSAAVTRRLFAEILRLIAEPRPPPDPAPT